MGTDAAVTPVSGYATPTGCATACERGRASSAGRGSVRDRATYALMGKHVSIPILGAGCAVGSAGRRGVVRRDGRCRAATPVGRPDGLSSKSVRCEDVMRGGVVWTFLTRRGGSSRAEAPSPVLRLAPSGAATTWSRPEATTASRRIAGRRSTVPFIRDAIHHAPPGSRRPWDVVIELAQAGWRPVRHAAVGSQVHSDALPSPREIHPSRAGRRYAESSDRARPGRSGA